MKTAFLPHRLVLGALSLGFAAFACSSSDGAKQSVPSAGSGGTAGSGGGSGAGGKAAGAGTGSGTAGGSCIPETPTAGSGAGGAAGESGAGGEAGGSDTRSVKLPWLHTEGNAIKDASGNTVVLRGVDLIDLAATEQWEGGINKMIDRLTNRCDSQGSSPGWSTKVLRFAITPGDDAAQGSPVKYEPDTSYYETLLRPAVDYATQKGLYVIIDWHYVDGTAAHPDTTAAFWSDMAPRFRNDSNVLFELFNEPTDGGDWLNTTKPSMQAWYDQVRKDAPDNLILVGSSNWDQQVGDAVMSPLDGTNIVYTAHMYPQHWQQTYLQNQITTAAMSAPVFVTEWGFEESQMMDLLKGTITSYGDPFLQFLEAQKISWSAWCASASWNPPMFNKDYTLRVGDGEMGGFVKDSLYEHRNDDLPQP